jgi:hypothetical protein
MHWQIAMSAAVGVDRETFAYGSTPFSSWAKLFLSDGRLFEAEGDDLFRQAVDRCRSLNHAERYVVFGSAIGLLCFYGTIGLMMRQFLT